MKAITIKQPWASLIVNKYKEYEFRSWKTKNRGKILIHAGMSTDKKYLSNFEDYDLTYINGAIIGEADIVDCIFVDKSFNDELMKMNNKVYSGNYIGMYAWKLENIKLYDKPIYCKGKLSFWEYKLSNPNITLTHDIKTSKML